MINLRRFYPNSRQQGMDAGPKPSNILTLHKAPAHAPHGLKVLVLRVQFGQPVAQAAEGVINGGALDAANCPLARGHHRSSRW